MKTWGYGGAPNQKWAFERATQVGGAGAYRQVNSTEVNCFGYALKVDKWIEPNYCYQNPTTLEYNLGLYYNRSIEPAILTQGLHVRRLKSGNDYIRPNEYKIVLRCGEQEIPEYSYSRKRASHFMTQISGGAWAEKIGKLPSENLGYINPSTYSWDYILPNETGTSSKNLYENFYDSSPLYMAIWK